MTKEEAIKIVQSATVWTDEEREALSMLIPELAENEDERILREIISALKFAYVDGIYDEHIAYLEKQKEQKQIFRAGDTIMAKPCIPDEYVKKFKALCDGYEIKLPNREYDIYHLCDDLAELFGNTGNQEENILPKDIERDATQFCFDKGINITPHQAWLIASHYQVMGFNAGMDEAHIQAKEVIKHPEKYGLQKEKKETVNIDHFKSFMLQYLQEAANRKDDSEIEADTDKWAHKLLSLVDAEAVNPVCLDEDTELGLDRALQVVKSAKGNLRGYQSDDGIYECDHAIGVLENILNNGMAQKVTEWSEEDIQRIRKEEYTKGFNDAAFGGKTWKPGEELNVNGGAKGKIMTEEDFKSLRNWLVEHGYYVGNHKVAEALRKLADMWDD